MPRNGSGTYTLPQSPFVAGTVISSAAVNSDLSDIASALTGSLPRDGQAGMTGQLKLPDGSTSSPSMTFTNEITTGFSRLSAGTIAVDILGAQIATITSAGWNGPVVGSTPVGTVVDFAGASAPSKWLLCFGQAVSRTTYSVLFGVIGTTYGAGDGSTTFNVIDLRGRVAAGADNMGGSAASRLTGATMSGVGLAVTGGAETEALTASQIPTITSNVSVSGTLNGSTSSVLLTQINIGLSGGGSSVPIPQTQGAASASVSGTLAGSATSNNTGGAAHINVQPTICTNKIIYAGV